ncbi:hypothetical protein C8J57DRAFT_1570041 [Mycena rebaudengoi]|nr:hypothetical protein C8J57DRAFT_1570041 [Mycena rebaudengoi]
MESEAEQVFAGQYHAHPYSEISCSIPVPGTGPNPELEGIDSFWIGCGWTCPGPGSHHYHHEIPGAGEILAIFAGKRGVYDGCDAAPGFSRRRLWASSARDDIMVEW